MTLRRKRLTKAAAQGLIQRLQNGAETPLSVRIAEPSYRNATRDLYKRVVEACKRYGVAETEYSQLEPGFVGLQKVFPIEISVSVPWDPENDPDANAWVHAVGSAARKAAAEKQPGLRSMAARFREGGSFPLLSDGQPILGARTKPRKREISAKQRAEIFVLRHFKKLPIDRIRRELGLPGPELLSRQAIGSAANSVAAQLKAKTR